MKLGFGRVLKAADLTQAEALPATWKPSAAPHGRVVKREVLDASERAQRLLAAAEERARAIVAEAELIALELRLRAEAEGRADAAAKLAAHVLLLREKEAQTDERALERSVELAKILAERLLGESLRLSPDQIVALARQALSEARGARRITLVAHPADAELLERSFSALGLSPDVARVQVDPARARSNLRLETEIGVLDAELAPQLERLAVKLRESLTSAGTAPKAGRSSRS
jgi:flagellar assembly protein FliH